MEIQEFAPRHLIAQLAFQKNQATVVDRRGALAEELREFLGSSSGSLDATAAEAATHDGMSKYRIGMAQLLAVVNICDFDDDSRKVEGFFRHGMDLLNAPPLDRIVAHTSDVAAVPSFDDLRDALFKALSPTSSRLREGVGMPLSDFGWSYDFGDDRWLVEVRLGPMRDDELRKIFEAPVNADFPAASLFLDVKVKLRVEDSKKDSLDLWASTLERNRQITASLAAWLTETLA
jgi:hypothetical protein